jgi:hypothetical protein
MQDLDQRETINTLPNGSGGVIRAQSNMDAVVVQVLPGGGVDGEPTFQRIVSILYKDSLMLPKLQEEARRIISTL